MGKAKSYALLGLCLVSCSGSDERMPQRATGTQQPAPGSSSADTTLTCAAPYELATPACDSCLEQRCCTALPACADDAECNAVYGCFSTCIARPTEGCPASCFGNGSPPPLFDAVLSCLFESCTAECTFVDEE